MADLAALLHASLNPTTRKQAEQTLNEFSTQPGFLPTLLQTVLEPSQDRSVRLAGAIFLKNVAKLRWEEDVQPLPEQDKVLLRSKLVPAMLALSTPSDKTIRAQVAESVSLIAELDFPTKWGDLIDQLVRSLSPTDYNVNIGVLETAHSIFRPWRAHVRSDELFTEINLVLNTFMTPFLQLFRQTATILLTHLQPQKTPQGQQQLLAQAQCLLVDIFYDFTCQDLPPAIEDSHDEFFTPGTGLFQLFLAWDPPALKGDPDDTTPSLPSKLKTGILEIAELYVKLYPDQLTRSPSVEGFVQGVWNLIGSGRLPGVADDPLVSQSLHFISIAIRSGQHKQLFGSQETISSLIQGVVVPNVGLRDHEIEQFEDDPLEYIRLSLPSPFSSSPSSSDTTTRRQAAADVLQALVTSGYEGEATSVVEGWIGKGLGEYYGSEGEGKKWKEKDCAIYLFGAVATRGSTTQHGVTATNTLVDVVKFFSDHVFQDLQAAEGSVHPILQVDAIRFLYTFRNQLTKEQLLSVLPQLVRHLGSENYVTYTYAAIAIERILFIKRGVGAQQLLFSQADIHDIAPALLNAILTKIESARSAEKVAENDHLMKCAMRVIATARQTLTPVYERTLQRLVAILGVISKNPSNPLFDQYIFESISALMRFVAGGSPNTLPTFEQALFGPFTIIIQQDIDQYIPYVFQVLAQMLELHTTSVPAEYRSLLPFLLTPAIWQQKGSIPGLVKLLRAFLAKDGKEMVKTGQFTAVLAVVQQRLIPSKLNDAWGFELLMGVVQNVPPADLKHYFRVVIVTLLTRLQTSKTDKFVYLFAYFLMFTMAIDVDGLNPDYVIGTVEEIQPQLWSQILNNFVVPQVPKMPPKDRKVVAVGLTRMLTRSEFMMREPNIQAWPAVFTALARLFREPQHLTSTRSADESADTGITEVDYEEQTAGYQAAYSRLAASESASVDPVAYVRDPRTYLEQELRRLSQAYPGVKNLLEGGSDRDVIDAFIKHAGAHTLS